MELQAEPETTRRRAVLVSWAVAGTGVLHLALGVISFRAPLTAMAGAGVWHSLAGQADRQAALWYFVGGGFLLTAGFTARWAVLRTGLLPPPLGWGLAVIAVLGALVAPQSGFWLVLVEGVLLSLYARRLVAGSRSAVETRVSTR